MITSTKGQALIAHFSRTASDLFRNPSGCLRHPFVVPGAQYGAELWDWDSYWTTLGLLELARATGDNAAYEATIRHGKGSLLNFLEHQSASGAVPIMMRSDNADVFDCLAQTDGKRNQAKPVLGQLALALVQAEASSVPQPEGETFIRKILPALERFYARWDDCYTHHGTRLLIWGSDVAIGVDNDPTTYARPPFSSANLLLNCLYHADLEAAATLAEQAGSSELAKKWSARSKEIANAIRVFCWDERDQFFYTIDTQCADHRAQLIPWAAPGAPLSWSSIPLRIQMFTGFLPLWAGIATPAQAKALLKHFDNADTFAAAYGVRSLSRSEPMYNLAISSNPSNWNGPVWILSNYLVWMGLRRYGFNEQAASMADKTLALLEQDISNSGSTHEYYEPDSGAPIMNKGFISWNLLACAMAN